MFYVHAPQSFGTVLNKEPDKCKAWDWRTISQIKAEETTEPLDILALLHQPQAASGGALSDAKFLEAVKASVEQVRQLTLHSWPSTHSNPPDVEDWRTTIACLIKNCQELEAALAPRSKGAGRDDRGSGAASR